MNPRFAVSIALAAAACGRSELAAPSPADAVIDVASDAATSPPSTDSAPATDSARDGPPDVLADFSDDFAIDSADVRSCPWGGFAPPVTYAADPGPRAIAFADFNGDGALDLVVAAWGEPLPSSTTNGFADVYLNEGKGAFAARVSYATDPEALTVVAGDFNGDGLADFVVGTNSPTLDVFANQGDGAFGSIARATTTDIPLAITVGDFRRIGRLDLAMTSDNGWIGVLAGHGDGTFGAPVTYATGLQPDSIAIGDVNGDGFDDIVATNTSWQCLPPDSVCPPAGTGWGTVNVWTNQGNGVFAPQVSYVAGIGAASVALGDFNGDGAPDIAVGNNMDNTLGVFVNAGHGDFGAQVTYANAGGGVLAADFTGDGHVDIAVIAGSIQDATGVLMLFANAGDGTFGAPVTYAIEGDPRAQIVADLNGDGLPDIAFVTANNTVGVWLSTCK